MLIQLPLFCRAALHLPDSLIKAGKKILYNDPREGISYLDSLLRQYPAISDSGKGVLNAHIGAGYAMTGDYDNAETRMIAAIRQLPDCPTRIYVMRNLASLYGAKSLFDKADSIFNALLKSIPDDAGQHNLKASLFSEYSQIFSDRGQNSVAIDLLKRGLAYCYKSPTPDSLTVGIIRAKLAKIYFSLENYAMASLELERAVAMADPDKNLHNYCTATLGFAHSLIEQGDPAKAAPWLKKAQESCRRLDNTELTGYAQMLYGCYYDLTGFPDQALDRFGSAYDLLKENRSAYLVDCATAWIGFLVRNGNYARAGVVISDPVLDSIVSEQIPSQLLKYKLACLPVIERLYPGEKTNRAFREIITLQDTVSRIKLDQSLVDSRAEFRMMEQEREKKRLEQQNTLLHQENKIRNGQILFSITSTLAAFFIIMYLVVRHRNRIMKQTMELDQTREEVMLKENLLKMEAELRSMRERVIEQQKQELRTSVSEIEQLRNEIGKLSDTNQKELEELFSRHLTDARGRISLEQFLQQFNSIFPRFFQNLALAYPGLSSADFQFCAMVRMNFSVKDISSILNIEPKSTYTKKYRIEEKMNLPKGIGLEQAVFAVAG